MWIEQRNVKEKEENTDNNEWKRNDREKRTTLKDTHKNNNNRNSFTAKKRQFADHQEKREIVKCLPFYLIKITLFKWLVKHIAC